MAERIARTEHHALQRLGTIAIVTFVLSVIALVGVIVVFVLNSDDASTTTVNKLADPCVVNAQSKRCKTSILNRAAAIPPQVACIIVSKGRIYGGLPDLDCNIESLITPGSLHPPRKDQGDSSNRPGAPRGPTAAASPQPVPTSVGSPSQSPPASGGQTSPPPATPSAPGSPSPATPDPGGGQGQPAGGGSSQTSLLNVPDPALGVNAPCVKVGALAAVGC